MLVNNVPDENVLNSPPQIIIKKENIGLEEYQHQKFQYNLFNSILKHDHYYEELSRIKDRLDKNAPSMQQVIHTDMKRANINKIYERKLNHDLTGPRGLNWQCKQELQRLQSSERNVERDLIRLKRDLARVSFSSSLNQCPLPLENNDITQVQSEQALTVSGINSPVQSPQKGRIILGRSISINGPRTSAGRLSPIHQKRFSLNQPVSISEKSLIEKQPNWKGNEDRSNLQKHAVIIDQEKREIEQKLKLFLH
ncbi:unnamed protein product [Rotaria magnacalcarata]|uniref:Uncharacterized protein n=2 Tax=Rotaria magnacalcarata TaxID=392030 RepID=A0A816HI41_9BILA|nr:unnamed protein product [Rotaria magnacalcarata]CAF1686324.1 unnamed protein product [Rotaria magnacalcarata]CAF1925987.1 unnamed protein product [Rotaria magnacalcarata]CAF2117558.1 unnamed protein product [Rotaria magnacalcarata]CAF3847291.1 unnamed protein product [Rotaria magnacalcarata]